ncbi:MAG: ATP-dependent DNA helicase, partial [Gammaproteobacteria bacterium]|nr:ATP-dependent DNA helicase [Gammaproteobacteria bacterium]
MSSENSEAAAVLGAAGPFADLIEGFSPRREQQAMAAVIDEVLAAREVLICEAGTGTGKTFAYLVPALQSGLKTVISTATKTLQDQLYHRDLPIVRRALDLSIDAALLKGRQNYLCLYRLERAVLNREVEAHRLPLLEHLGRWAGQSDSGDLEEVRELDDDPQIRFLVTSTTENCLGQDCPSFDDCFVVRARRTAAAADLVVVNHHLLFADLVLRETGFAELLPAADAIIVDEAHKLPDIASSFFSHSVSAQQLGNLCRDVLEAARDEAPDTPALNASSTALDTAQFELRRFLGKEPQRMDWASFADRNGAAERLQALSAALEELGELLGRLAERGVALASCHERAIALSERLGAFDRNADELSVRWLETGRGGFSLHDTPITVAAEFSQRLENSKAAWIMTSATLAVEGRFDHFANALGIKNAREHLWQSPFDYAKQSLLYIPRLHTEPRHPDFESDLVDAALPLLECSHGRAFFLFTSYRALNICADLLRQRADYSLLVQGEAPRSDLLHRFETMDNAV